MKARVQITAGDLSSAGAWADDQGISVNDQPDYLREDEHLSLIRLMLAQQRGEQRAAVIGLLDRLHGSAVEAGRDGSVREIRVLQALARQADGDLPEALAALNRRLVRD